MTPLPTMVECQTLRLKFYKNMNSFAGIFGGVSIFRKHLLCGTVLSVSFNLRCGRVFKPPLGKPQEPKSTTESLERGAKYFQSQQ